jgi:hypothetical protein
MTRTSAMEGPPKRADPPRAMTAPMATSVAGQDPFGCGVSVDNR